MLLTDKSDEELIVLYRQKNLDAIDEILNRYKQMVRSKVSSMHILGGDIQDLTQEGMIGLIKAVRDYSFEQNASFNTFAHLCVERQIYNAISASSRLKNMPLNEYISITSEHVTEDGNSTGPLVDNLAGESALDPEGHIISQENVDRINGLIESSLTKVERDVFRLHLIGFPTSRIAGILSIQTKSADNALQRAKGKLRKELEIV